MRFIVLESTLLSFTHYTQESDGELFTPTAVGSVCDALTRGHVPMVQVAHRRQHQGRGYAPGPEHHDLLLDARQPPGRVSRVPPRSVTTCALGG
jgi:hypothetical protein